jgi:predicted esterase YcpF (UPF0227 family)
VQLLPRGTQAEVVDRLLPKSLVGRQDNGGILVDLSPSSDSLVISCSGIVPKDTVMYAMDHSARDIATHKMFVCDRTSRWYYGGVEGISHDFDSTVSVVGDLIGKIKPTTCVTVGTSGGGYLAVALAAILGLDRALAFGPQSDISAEYRKSIGDWRWQTNMNEIAELGCPTFDILSLIDGCALRTTEFYVIYSAGDSLDRKHAERLAACENVHLHALPDVNHNSSAALRDTGHLVPLLETFIGQASPATGIDEILRSRQLCSG